MSTPSRSEIRRLMRERRRELGAHEHQRCTTALTRQLSRLSIFIRSRHIALYLPNDGEVDMRPLIALACKMGKKCYLPVLSPIYHNRLWFAPYKPGDKLMLNRFGIPEPVHNWSAMRPAWTLDLLLAPLVAFDEQGNRLGMGGGYYDRTLAYLGRRQHWNKPRLIGTAYEFQKVESLPHEPWDIPLHGIVTDEGRYGF